MLKQQKYVAVLTQDKEGLKCDLANLGRENKRLKQKIEYLEEDMGERDKQIEEHRSSIVCLQDYIAKMEE